VAGDTRSPAAANPACTGAGNGSLEKSVAAGTRVAGFWGSGNVDGEKHMLCCSKDRPAGRIGGVRQAEATGPYRPATTSGQGCPLPGPRASLHHLGADRRWRGGGRRRRRRRRLDNGRRRLRRKRSYAHILFLGACHVTPGSIAGAWPHIKPISCDA
ncbi:hypothetical protein LCGC14_2638790, partial [marine sediment metagenome]